MDYYLSISDITSVLLPFPQTTRRMFDLAHTCDEADPSNTKNCRCNDARKLLQMGILDCSDYKCPKNCQVCDVCMDVSC